MPKTTAKPAAAKPAVLGTYGTMYYVKDMKKAVAWYSEKLGVKPAHSSPHWTEIPLSGHSLALSVADKDTRDAHANGSLIIRVEGLSRLIEDLKAKGASVIGEPREVQPEGQIVQVADPDGNLVHLYEGPKPAV